MTDYLELLLERGEEALEKAVEQMERAMVQPGRPRRKEGRGENPQGEEAVPAQGGTQPSERPASPQTAPAVGQVSSAEWNQESLGQELEKEPSLNEGEQWALERMLGQVHLAQQEAGSEGRQEIAQDSPPFEEKQQFVWGEELAPPSLSLEQALEQQPLAQPLEQELELTDTAGEVAKALTGNLGLLQMWEQTGRGAMPPQGAGNLWPAARSTPEEAPFAGRPGGGRDAGTAEWVDRAFRRDSRRYDGGFFLY